MNSPESIAVVADTTCGKLEGAQRGGVCVFKGIPFATARRWHAPEPMAPWSGTRPARHYAHMAPQNPTQLQGLLGTGGGTQGEDCLHLNVWTPACDSRKRPVMVWIHGGAFTTGAGSLGLYHGQHLSESGDVVVVTINYRLGSFGFLRLADVTGGKIGAGGSEGLMDQIAALRWVQDNIAGFGGDPSNVTIFGESAGGMSVVSLMASPQAQGLFHKAICQSGGGHFSHTRDHASRIAEVFIRHTGLGVAALEDAPIEVLLKAQLTLLNEVDNLQDPHKLGTMAFQPVVDGNVLPSVPIEAIRNGSARGVPLIAGTTQEEWRLWTALDPKIQAMDEARLQRWAERMFGEHGPTLIAASGATLPYERYVEMQTLRAFREPTARLLDAQSAVAPVYAYRFDWRSPAVGGVFGSCHAIELGFVFGSHSLKGPDNFFGKGDVADAINRSMMQAWASFARSGAPVIDGSAWPQRKSDQPKHVVFGGGNEVASAVEDYTRETAWRDLPDSRVGV
jgi:para-nitrobenzyl esterase